MTINLNGVEFYTAQEVDARIREAIAMKDKKEDTPYLPIGTLVKVVGNRAGHEHEVGEILPITEVGEDVDEPGYRLDDRLVGWVNVEDIELVSFPEEEESTSGDEGLAVDEDGAEIKAGDIVIATEDELDITEGVEYEIKERETGTLYFLDDDGDIRYVNVHEEYLRKKSAKRGFKRGDVVYVNEEITDSSGDSICPGVITEFLLERWVLSPNGSIVVVGDGDIGKITLVCRAEDRMDKSKEDD